MLYVPPDLPIQWLTNGISTKDNLPIIGKSRGSQAQWHMLPLVAQIAWLYWENIFPQEYYWANNQFIGVKVDSILAKILKLKII